MIPLSRQNSQQWMLLYLQFQRLKPLQDFLLSNQTNHSSSWSRSCRLPSAQDSNCWRFTSLLSPTSRPRDKEKERKQQPRTSKAETKNDSREPSRRSSITTWQQAPMSFFLHRSQPECHQPAIYFWHGPARVVATQLPSTVWLSYNHHLVKASPEKLRPASEEEFYSISGWLEGISNAKKQLETYKIKGMIELSQENDEQPPTERQDFWRREGNFWIRVHKLPRQELFRPDHDLSKLPVHLDQLLPWRKTIMTITDGDQEILEDEWTHGQDFPSHGHEWTGETWLEEKLSTEPRDHLKRPADPLVPQARITQKARIDPEQMIPLSRQNSQQWMLLYLQFHRDRTSCSRTRPTSSSWSRSSNGRIHEHLGMNQFLTTVIGFWWSTSTRRCLGGAAGFQAHKTRTVGDLLHYYLQQVGHETKKRKGSNNQGLPRPRQRTTHASHPEGVQ